MVGTKGRKGTKVNAAVVAPRGKTVVQSVCDATREELVRVGFRGLRIDDVAARAGVHKTTVYRRWPTKVDLVREALMNLAQSGPAFPDTGSLRGDLIGMAMQMTAFFTSVTGQGIIRMIITERSDPELFPICEAVRQTRETVAREWIERSLKRGLLTDFATADLLWGTLVGTIHHRLMVKSQIVDEPYITQLVDLLLLGALPRKAPAAGKPHRNRK